MQILPNDREVIKKPAHQHHNALSKHCRATFSSSRSPPKTSGLDRSIHRTSTPPRTQASAAHSRRHLPGPRDEGAGLFQGVPRVTTGSCIR